jgi:AcrR family transcriptional regulator
MGEPIPNRLAARLRPVAARALGTFGPVNLTEIAAATGIPRSTLYYNFKGSEELTRFFVDELLTQIGAAVRDAVATHSDPADQLAAALVVNLNMSTEDPGLTLALLRGVLAGEDFGERLRYTRETVFAPLRTVLAAGIAAGAFVDVDIDETIAALIGIIALVTLHHLGSLGPAAPTPPEHSFISVVMRGLTMSPPAPIRRRTSRRVD